MKNNKIDHHEPEQAPDLSVYIEVICQRFRPAVQASDATHRLSTNEIKIAMEELNPGLKVSEAHVFDAMTEAGFLFNTSRGSQSIRFQWLLVEK